MLKFLLGSAILFTTAEAVTPITGYNHNSVAKVNTDVTLTVSDPIGTNKDTISAIAVPAGSTTYVGLFVGGSNPVPASHVEGELGGPVTKISCTSAATCALPLYQGGDKFNPVSAGAYTIYQVNGLDNNFVTSISEGAQGTTGNNIVVTINPYISAWGSTLSQSTFPAVERGDDVLVTWDTLPVGSVIELKDDAAGLSYPPAVGSSTFACGVSYYQITAADRANGKTRGTISLKTSSTGVYAKFAQAGNYQLSVYANDYTIACPGVRTALANFVVRPLSITESDTLTLAYNGGTATTANSQLANVEAGTKVTVNYILGSATTAGTYVGLWKAHATDYSEVPSFHDVGTTAGKPLARSFLPVGVSGAGSIELLIPLTAPLHAAGYIVYMFNINDVDFSPMTQGSYGIQGLMGPSFTTRIGGNTNSDLDIVESPSGQPSGQPSGEPSGEPSGVPTSPSGQPTGIPTSSPSYVEEPWGEWVWTEKRHRKAGMCENQCSGHGTCEVNGNCKCFAGLDGEDEWTGPDCSSRTCPFDFAWVGASINSNNLHPWAECSNKGLCDRSSGECQCFTGYEGAACQRTVCPDNCNDQGTCWPEKHLASKAGRVYEAPWDAMKHVGCLCDAGYRGPACDQQECPSGADPLAGYGNEAGRDCSGRGICDYSNGICACFTGFFGTRCQHQTTVM
jgi:hypothetical protein